MSIKAKTGTASQVASAAGSSSLTQGEVILITDSNTLVVAANSSLTVNVGGAGVGGVEVGDVVYTTNTSHEFIDDRGTFIRADGSVIPYTDIYADLYSKIGHRFYDDRRGVDHIIRARANTGFGLEFSSCDWSNDDRYLAVVRDNVIGGRSNVYVHETTVSSYDVVASARLTEDRASGVAFSPDDRYLVVGYSSNVRIFDWTSKNLSAVLPDPSTQPTGEVTDVSWSPNSQYLAVSHLNTPFVTIYDWANGSPVKITNPGTLPTGNGLGVAWSPNGQYLAVSHLNTPFVTIYDWANGSPVKITNPGTLPTNHASSVDWSPNGRYLAVSHANTPFITIYDWQTGSPVKITNPSTLPTGNASCAKWSKSGRYLAVGHRITPFVTTYDFANDTPVKVADAAVLPPGNTLSLTWTSNGAMAVTSTPTSNSLIIYGNADNSNQNFYLPSVPISNGVFAHVKVSDDQLPWTYLSTNKTWIAPDSLTVTLLRDVTVHHTLEITFTSGFTSARIDHAQRGYSDFNPSVFLNEVCSVDSSNTITYSNQTISRPAGTKVFYRLTVDGSVFAGKLTLREGDSSGPILDVYDFSYDIFA